MTRPSKTRIFRAGRLCAICLLMPLLLSSMLCSMSCAAARLSPDGEVVMPVEDARLLLGEIRGLRAERDALQEALRSERTDVDRLIQQTQELIAAMEDERKAWQERLQEERRNARKNGLILLLVGLAAGSAL